MEFTDNLVIKTIWKACLIQCKGDFNKAEELFNKTIRETQGLNTLERSALLRSDNSLIKSMMMFTVQPSHNLSNLMECVLHSWTNRKTGAKMTNEQKSQYTGAIVGILIEGAIYTALGKLFKYLLGKDDDDEYKIESILESYFNDNILGMIPFLNNLEVDFNSKNGQFIKFNDFSVGAIAQVYEAFEEVQNVFDPNANPEAKFKSFAYALGMLTGIPTRNLNNYGTMLLKTVAPDTAYQWEIMSSGASLYNKETVNTALERNQTKKAWNYYKAYTDKIIELDDEVLKVMFELYSCGYKDAYVKQVPYYIEAEDGTTYEIDREKFVNTYSRLNSSLKRLINNARFTNLSDGKREKLIQKLVKYHYNIAYKEQSGENLTVMERLISEGFDSPKILIYLHEISFIKETSKTTRKEAVQKYINRLPIPRNEKFLLFYLAGYKLPEDKMRIVKNLLKNKGISKTSLKVMFDN
jgi:hypothetical protein